MLEITTGQAFLCCEVKVMPLWVTFSIRTGSEESSATVRRVQVVEKAVRRSALRVLFMDMPTSSSRLLVVRQLRSLDVLRLIRSS